MGKILTRLKNPLRYYNIENRAHKIISESKPTPAPRHEKDQLTYERLMQDHPEVYEESLKKNEQLDNHLRNIYVTSKDVKYTPKLFCNDSSVNLKSEKKLTYIHLWFSSKPDSNPSRPLPLDRKHVEEFEYGTKEPANVPIGKVTLRMALEFLTKHQNDPKEFTVKKIADDYSLSEEKVGDILKYFRVFQVYIPKEKKSKATFIGPSLPRFEIRKRPAKALPDDSSSDKKT